MANRQRPVLAFADFDFSASRADQTSARTHKILVHATSATSSISTKSCASPIMTCFVWRVNRRGQRLAIKVCDYHFPSELELSDCFKLPTGTRSNVDKTILAFALLSSRRDRTRYAEFGGGLCSLSSSFAQQFTAISSILSLDFSSAWLQDRTSRISSRGHSA